MVRTLHSTRLRSKATILCSSNLEHLENLLILIINIKVFQNSKAPSEIVMYMYHNWHTSDQGRVLEPDVSSISTTNTAICLVSYFDHQMAGLLFIHHPITHWLTQADNNAVVYSGFLCECSHLCCMKNMPCVEKIYYDLG